MLVLTFVSPSAATAKEVEDRKWLLASTANFEIHSLLSEKETLELVQHLEIFRYVAAMFTGVGLQDSTIPTTVFAVPAGSVSREMSIDSFIGGRFIPGWRRNWIVVKDMWGTDEAAMIMHEYVHFLIYNFFSRNYPMWFDEGLAEYLSSMQIRADDVLVGDVPPGRASALSTRPWIHLREIVTRKRGDDWSRQRSWMFYSGAWALVHYLMNRDDQETQLNDQLSGYLDDIDAGADLQEAFETAFGVTVDKLDRNVRSYLDGNRVPGLLIATDTLTFELEAEVSRMSREQVSLALGEFALMKGDYERAQRWYSIAAEDPALEAQAEAGVGSALKIRGRNKDAHRHLERALELAPDDPFHWLDMADFWVLQMQYSKDLQRRDERFENARKHYVNALKLGPDIPETYAMYGRAYLLYGDDYDKAVEMLEEAQRLLRSSTQVKIWLAQAYRGANRHDEATAAAQLALSWTHDESTAAAAREILGLTTPEWDDKIESDSDTSN